MLFFAASGTARGELIEITQLGTPSQTSEWNGGLYPANLAVDGNPNTFCHSDGGTPNNAWELRLDEEHPIASIELDMRADCCPGRMGGTTLRLFDRAGDSVFHTSVVDPGMGQTARFELPPGTFARSIRVGFENGATNPGANTTLIHLGEVRVFSEIDLKPVIDSFSATPTNLAAGEPTTLSWLVSGADSIEISGLGSVGASGSQQITPASTRVITLHASNAAGSRSQSLAVIVDGVALPVQITELMASNRETIIRSDGSSPDWIELWNPNPVAVDLAGFRLSDDPEEPARYVFPSTPVPAGGFLLVDAATSSLDGIPATGFALSREDGASLTLSAPDGSVVQTIAYPKQHADVSFGTTPDGELKFFLSPTPGAPNQSGATDGFVEDTKFSIDRGFYDSPQSVAITTATPGATVYYTTDGSQPFPDNPAAITYSTPVQIATTTVLRAAAYLDGFQPTNIDTHTYIFTSQVGSQSPAPARFPAAWVPNLNGLRAPVAAFSHFGMDASVLATLPLADSSGAQFDLPAALGSIPTMSLAIDAAVLLDPVEGLHINAQSRGRAWERPASIEIIDPEAGAQVQANCGLRMHGGWNRFPEMLKKSFRLYFRSDYGDSKLRFPLFPGSGIDEFDAIILRSGNGKSWASPWRALSGGGNSLPRTTYIRDQFMRDLQAATGNHHVPGTFVHLYINGHYWGLYNPVERPDESFAASRFGGRDDDYDVIKWQRGVGHRVAAGDDLAWNALISLVRSNPSDPTIYAEIGNRLDLTSFVDYMLVNFFTANSDWIDNNVYAMRRREPAGSFRFFCWDSEESLLGVGGDVTNRLVNDTCTEIHHALRTNQDYRQLFADRAQKHLFFDGALTPGSTDAIFARHAATLDRAIVAESARWGGLLRPAAPYDRADWLAEVDNLRSHYLSQRVGITLDQLRADDLFANTGTPEFLPRRGGHVPTGSEIALHAEQGQVYYTLDGSDPRLPGGAISQQAIAFDGTRQTTTLVGLGGVWSYLDNGSDLGDSSIVSGAAGYDQSHWKHPDFDDGDWLAGPAPLGYGGFGDQPIATEVGYGGDPTLKHTTTYFRKSFHLPAAQQVLELDLLLRRDDGAVVYLNGHEVARSNFPISTDVIGADTFASGASGTGESDLQAFAVPPTLLVDGSNTLAVEVHQASNNSSDLGFDLQLVATVSAEGGSITISGDTLVRARTLDGNGWSAIDEALFLTGGRAADLYVSEIMYHPAAPSPGESEFLEIANRGTVTHELRDLRITGGIQFDFSTATTPTLAPGERIVLTRDLDQFAATYPSAESAGEYSGALGNGGDQFSLETRDGALLWTISYGDDAPWPHGTDGDGRSLVYIGGDPAEAVAWRASTAAGGNPGDSDSVAYPDSSDLLTYSAIRLEVLPTGELQLSTVLGADAARVSPQWSNDLVDWKRDGLRLVRRTVGAGNTSIDVWRLDDPPESGRLFFRAEVSLR